MKLQLVLAAATMLAIPALMPASAQSSNVYASGGYTRLDTGGAEVGAVQARVGVGFGQYFAVEGEGAVGVEDDGATSLSHEIGVFAVGKFPITSQFDVFGRVGVTQQKYDTALGDAEDEGLAYGAGAQWNFTSADGLRADYTRHDYDPGETDQWSVSYVRKF